MSKLAVASLAALSPTPIIPTIQKSIILSSLSPLPLSRLPWRPLCSSNAELNIDHTCCLGQSFSWRRLAGTSVYVSSYPFPVALRRRGTSEITEYCPLLPAACGGDEDDLLKAYFQLSTSLSDLYEQWSSSCVRMHTVAHALPGVRVMRQKPWECLVSFICSSNNNVKRIGGILQRMREKYGQYLCSIRRRSLDAAADDADADDDWEVVCLEEAARKYGQDDADVHLFEFPSVSTLAAASEEDLRLLGLGYRAKYIDGSAKIILQESEEWLEGLRNVSRGDAMEALLRLPGVGPKVADCVALFSLDQTAAVPIDTHVWDIAERDYGCGFSGKSLTAAVYAAVGDVFRARFGSHAGWAHSVLFAAELSEFRHKLPAEMREEMSAFSAQKRSRAAKNGEDNIETSRSPVKSERATPQKKAKSDKSLPPHTPV